MDATNESALIKATTMKKTLWENHEASFYKVQVKSTKLNLFLGEKKLKDHVKVRKVSR